MPPPSLEAEIQSRGAVRGIGQESQESWLPVPPIKHCQNLGQIPGDPPHPLPCPPKALSLVQHLVWASLDWSSVPPRLLTLLRPCLSFPTLMGAFPWWILG